MERCEKCGGEIVGNYTETKNPWFKVIDCKDNHEMKLCSNCIFDLANFLWKKEKD